MAPAVVEEGRRDGDRPGMQRTREDNRDRALQVRARLDVVLGARALWVGGLWQAPAVDLPARHRWELIDQLVARRQHVGREAVAQVPLDTRPVRLGPVLSWDGLRYE